MDFPTWEQVTQSENPPEAEPLQFLLIQAVAALSTQEDYEEMTPPEVYDAIVKVSQEIGAIA